MSKTVQVQTIQFSISTVFCLLTVKWKKVNFKQPSLAKLQFSSIWPIDRTLSGATTSGQSEPGSDGNKEVFYIRQAPALLEPHHQIVSCHNQDTRWGSLTPL